MSGPRDPRSGASAGGARSWLPIAAAVVLLTSLHLHLVASLPDRGYFAKYTHFADRILQGDIPRERLGDLSPGYLWLIVAVRAAGLSPSGIVTLQVLCLGLSALLAASAASRISGPWAGLLAAVALLGHRASLVNAAEIEPEPPILLANTLGLALVLAWDASRRSALLALAGAAFGVSAAIRPVAVLPLAAIAGFVTWRTFRTGPTRPAVPFRRSLPLALVAGAAVPVGAVLAVNVALTGSAFVMNPGTVFYEGMNPSANACGETEPRIVKDVEATLAEPDSLHVAYRIVAQRAIGRDAKPQAVNRYWSGKARAFVAEHPAAAARLLSQKLLMAVSSHEVYDLVTQVRKDAALQAYPFVPFGVLFGLALVGLWLGHEHPGAVAVGIYTAAAGAVLPTFYVIVRQRNTVVPAMAILGSVGTVELLRRLATDRLRGGLAAAMAVVAAIATTLPTDEVRENRRSWWIAESAHGSVQRARRAAAARQVEAVRQHLVAAATWPTWNEPAVPARLLREAALAELPQATPERRFDLSLALLAAEDWATAARVLEELRDLGYRPIRGNMAISSVSYHRARALLHLGRSDEAAADAAAAGRELPGDAFVLALQRALARKRGDSASVEELGAELERLHDPFTARFATALALLDTGAPAEAVALLDGLAREIPEWPRPAALRERLISGARS